MNLKKITPILLTLIFLISGCYTQLSRPKVDTDYYAEEEEGYDTEYYDDQEDIDVNYYDFYIYGASPFLLRPYRDFYTGIYIQPYGPRFYGFYDPWWMPGHYEYWRVGIYDPFWDPWYDYWVYYDYYRYYPPYYPYFWAADYRFRHHRPQKKREFDRREAPHVKNPPQKPPTTVSGDHLKKPTPPHKDRRIYGDVARKKVDREKKSINNKKIVKKPPRRGVKSKIIGTPRDGRKRKAPEHSRINRGSRKSPTPKNIRRSPAPKSKPSYSKPPARTYRPAPAPKPPRENKSPAKKSSGNSGKKRK